MHYALCTLHFCTLRCALSKCTTQTESRGALCSVHFARCTSRYPNCAQENSLAQRTTSSANDGHPPPNTLRQPLLAGALRNIHIDACPFKCACLMMPTCSRTPMTHPPLSPAAHTVTHHLPSASSIAPLLSVSSLKRCASSPNNSSQMAVRTPNNTYATSRTACTHPIRCLTLKQTVHTESSTLCTLCQMALVFSQEMCNTCRNSEKPCALCTVHNAQGLYKTLYNIYSDITYR